MNLGGALPSVFDSRFGRTLMIRRPAKETMHPRNRFREGYDFERLVKSSPALKNFVRLNAYRDLSIDYADPFAVKALNRALLKDAYGLSTWDVPGGYLCPPIPGRSDYLHYLADLLARRGFEDPARASGVGAGHRRGR